MERLFLGKTDLILTITVWVQYHPNWWCVRELAFFHRHCQPFDLWISRRRYRHRIALREFWRIKDWPTAYKLIDVSFSRTFPSTALWKNPFIIGYKTSIWRKNLLHVFFWNFRTHPSSRSYCRLHNLWRHYFVIIATIIANHNRS